MNEEEQLFGVICGEQYETDIIVTGSQARVAFHSDSEIEGRGFLLFFTAVNGE